MKKLLIISYFVFVTALFSACYSTSVNIKTEETNNFKKNIMTKYKIINSLVIRYSSASLQFNYKFSKKPTENEMFDIFRETKGILIEKKVQDSIFEDLEFEIYPDAYVQFDVDSDDKFDYQFYSLYYKKPYRSDRENEIDGYKTWYWWDFKNEGRRVE
ncbi:MAG: hypothetical protein ACOYWZ_12010 [Bacillota bacterium]